MSVSHAGMNASGLNRPVWSRNIQPPTHPPTLYLPTSLLFLCLSVSYPILSLFLTLLLCFYSLVFRNVTSRCIPFLTHNVISLNLLIVIGFLSPSFFPLQYLFLQFDSHFTPHTVTGLRIMKLAKKKKKNQNMTLLRKEEQSCSTT